MVHVDLQNKVKEKQAILKRMIGSHNELVQSVEESRMDYDMEKMTINQLKERSKDIDETAKRRGSQTEELYKSILSNSAENSPIKIEPMKEEMPQFDEIKISRHVENMSYHERVNYLR